MKRCYTRPLYADEHGDTGATDKAAIVSIKLLSYVVFENVDGLSINCFLRKRIPRGNNSI